ncbi:MAG: BamA/TamA family outer membrane protein [candidate division KSB1 bacterium]|nr:BamA/TamA family outer membrane protein [candidate division KSB1 bacterium]MDZ7335970.1 BamA/TamA family outer membrane protein [candidate division KSB1 bacterium]MDZ7357936.1 BamA/TamA family outer membrane protein [candidate division KSB1 bacterium]MDZ7376263.1 BamA/TamA family outer membrane protein [candidate division KSB1 bacterium]MDZ7402191.1 BamA/TamA family outer membrane protein [candidate division KSB1 bacterium]
MGQIYLNSNELDEAQCSDSIRYRIDKIELLGNNKTRPEVILRELHFSEKQSVSLSELLAALKRVQSLFLFNRVKFDIVEHSDSAKLIITVYERWYIFPIPLVYRNERTWKKISYGGKLLYYNFLGRNILLNLSAAFGYNPQIRFSYYNPWFLGEAKLFTIVNLFYSRIRSLSLALNAYEDRRLGLEWTIGKRFGHYFYTGATLSYMKLTAPAGIGLTLSPSGTDYLPSILVGIQYDNRDLKEYPHRGWWVGFSGKHVGIGERINYDRYSTDLRCYLPLSHHITLALRGSANLSHGKIPSYDRTFLGYEERVRGRYYEIFEGENFAFGGAELRFPLLKIRYLDVEPLIDQMRQYSSNLKFGISAGLFFDSGAVWSQNQPLSIRQVKSGFGMGLHFHLPYVEVFRVECGFNKRLKAQAIADIEVAF